MRTPHRNRKFRIVAVLVVLLLMLTTIIVSAHPGGEFAISRYSQLQPGTDSIDLFYIIDMAEIPTFQEREKIDTNEDGEFSSAETDAYLETLLPTITSNLSLNLADGTAVSFELVDQKIETYLGDSGLENLRIELNLTAPVSAADSTLGFTYTDGNFPENLGWKEIVVKPQDGAALVSSTAATEDSSAQLTEYPDDILSMDVTEATIEFGPTSLVDDGLTVAAPEVEAENSLLSYSEDGFARLIETATTDPLGIAIALLLSLVYGAAHALTPGHGKTIVGAYLVGSRGTIQQALFLGLTTTVTHTAGVFAVGLVTMFASQYILPEQLYPWMSVLSGLLVMSIGFTMLRMRSRAASMTAIAEGDHDFIDDETYHAHAGGIAHSHKMPTEISWGSLLTLGVSGGLIPCPSALVVMLAAIAFNRIGFGMILIVTFSIGLAGVLTLMGIMFVKARDRLDKLSERNERLHGVFSKGLFRYLPVASAAFIMVIGAILTYRAILELGIL